MTTILTNSGISIDSVIQKEIIVLWGKENVTIQSDIFENLISLNMAVKQIGTIEVIIMPVITSLNCNHISELVSKIEGLLTHCHVTWDFSKYCNINNNSIDELLHISDENYVMKIVETLKSGSVIDSNKLLLYAIGDGGNDLPQENPHITVCAPSFFVANNGDVYPCQGTENKENFLGNICDSNLEQLFNRENFKKMRNSLIVNSLVMCNKCEFRFVCTNKDRPCQVAGKEDIDCKIDFIQKLYVNTLENKHNSMLNAKDECNEIIVNRNIKV